MNEDFLNNAKDLWNDPAPNMEKEQVERAYSHIHGYIIKSRISSGIRYGAFVIVAAACCIVAGIFIGRHGDEKPVVITPVEYVEYVAASGETKEFMLPDGSQVMLNSQSRLVSQKTMDASTRDVFLCGEAFFDVAKDSLHPFIVHASGNEIKVKGTKFNVRAFLDEDSSTTTLIEGKVEVTVPGQANPISLTPGMALAVSNDQKNVSIYQVDENNAIGWYKGEFNAYHMTLEQICKDLEKRFNVKIMISNDKIASKVYYASFVNNEDADGILNALNIHRDFRIRKQDKFYYIY